jgi:uncharacterized cupin superfamily protein
MDTRLRHLSDVPVRTGAPAAGRDLAKPDLFAGKSEAQLGRAVGLTQFGVNMVTLAPGSMSSLRHWHEEEDEFVLVLSGCLTLIDENGQHPLEAGHIVGFPAGRANAHHLANRSAASADILVVGTRKPGLETIHYPDDFAEPRFVRRNAAGERI